MPRAAAPGPAPGFMRLTPDSRAPAKADPWKVCVGCNPCPCSGSQSRQGSMSWLWWLCWWLLLVWCYWRFGGCLNLPLCKTGAGTSGVPAASFIRRGLTARVYVAYTEVGRAILHIESLFGRRFAPVLALGCCCCGCRCCCCCGGCCCRRWWCCWWCCCWCCCWCCWRRWWCRCGWCGWCCCLLHQVGAKLGHLGAMLSHLGVMLGDLGAMLGLCWAMLGPCWAHVGPSWGHLGPMLGRLGPSWSHVGPMLGHLGAILGLCWPYVGAGLPLS